MMMRTVIAVRQYLVAVFLIATGLIVSGCGDTASVNPAAQLASLTVTPGTLSPAFSGGTTQYHVQLDSNVQNVTVTAQPAEGGDTVTINNQPTTSSVITLGAAGTTTTVSISVSGSGEDPRTYVVSLVRAGLNGNNSLESLTVSPGTLAPAFAMNTQDYTVDVANNVTSVTVTATLQDTDATMTIEGQGTSSGQGRSIPLGAAGTSASIDILVTAQNGSQKPYLVTVNRALPSSDNNLSALSVSVGTVAQTLSPTFTPSTTNYTVNVATGVTQVIVSATKDDPNAVMAIGSVTVAAGTATGQAPITLMGQGTTTPVSIAVTAQSGGAPRTYTVDVIRAAPAAPPAPASAPDLIAADDSGLLPGNDSDNITNVTTPRFQIPQPGAGETPNLHVDGTKVGATFDPAANTLQPTTPLSDGNHSITSTVTNTATTLESTQSAPLTVTIDTAAPAPP